MHQKNISEIVMDELHRINKDKSKKETHNEETVSIAKNKGDSTLVAPSSWKEFTVVDPSTAEFRESMYLTRDVMKMTGFIK